MTTRREFPLKIRKRKLHLQESIRIINLSHCWLFWILYSNNFLDSFLLFSDFFLSFPLPSRTLYPSQTRPKEWILCYNRFEHSYINVFLPRWWKSQKKFTFLYAFLNPNNFLKVFSNLNWTLYKVRNEKENEGKCCFLSSSVMWSCERGRRKINSFRVVVWHE